MSLCRSVLEPFSRRCTISPTTATRSFSQEDSQQVADVHSSNKKSPKLVKFSWKMNEFKYYDVPSPFPTLAHGLHNIESSPEDKFFNIGEVPWTTWSSLEAHTKPPYTLMLMLESNGCIIFVAALSPSKLLVTSKHSLGPVQGAPESHAQAGERWLHHHLKQAGKTTEQLAETLWTKNWTVAAELCDDGFEEHVFPDVLHLHNINECSRHFRTQPTAVVEAFAREWAIIPTPSLELPSVQDVKTFTEEIGRNGTWNGKALEGFVVFFFKVKFDEPYMMYRDWREITKALLTRGEGANLPKSKMARSETKAYVKWVKEEIKKHPELFKGYTKGHGIIATHERFLRWLETGVEERDKEKVESAERVSAPSDKKFGKTIIMPVAVPGVGKTTVAVALAELDDVRAKKRGPAFIQNVKKLVRDDAEIMTNAVKGMHPPVRLLALNWSLDQPHAGIHLICADRIMARGTNHQTLHGDEQGKAHESVMWRFLIDTSPLADDDADTVIEMDTREDLEHALSRADAEHVGAALARARGYRPARTDAEQQRKPNAPPRALDAPIASARNGDAMRKFWDALKARSGVARRPHVTISVQQAATSAWTCGSAVPRCMRSLHRRCSARGSDMSWRTERIMAATVEDLRVDDPEADDAQAGTAFVSQLGHALRDSLHVTIGLRDADVEAGALVASFRRGAAGVHSVPLENVYIRGRTQGLFS
ncbi:RNA ligase-domain-containing protein [Lactarius pseudohatsudake]|nr:RNA ligase-domain-containing protein [Lactarius pseudohatsudake]